MPAPRNTRELTAILEAARAKLVQSYRANPAPWPHGIDHPGNRWYGDGSAWTQERIARALAWPGEPKPVRSLAENSAASISSAPRSVESNKASAENSAPEPTPVNSPLTAL